LGLLGYITDAHRDTVGFYANIWWLDALGGLLLSLIVIFNWSQTSFEHIRHLSGFSATADQRNIREP
jgi:divalent metal cation (Fe/Co/Zn/Cd) transporter